MKKSKRKPRTRKTKSKQPINKKSKKSQKQKSQKKYSSSSKKSHDKIISDASIRRLNLKINPKQILTKGAIVRLQKIARKMLLKYKANKNNYSNYDIRNFGYQELAAGIFPRDTNLYDRIVKKIPATFSRGKTKIPIIHSLPITAMIEYFLSTILNIAGQQMREKSNATINVHTVNQVIRQDIELNLVVDAL